MKKFFAEFREFALKGNMMDLAIGMIIGSAFTSIISSLVDDVINPFLGLFTGQIDFSNLFISLDGNAYATLDAAETAGAAVIKYGSFISNVINFLIMAFVVFLIVKGMNTMRSRADAKKKTAVEEVAPETKICPYCQSEISVKATRCPHCTSMLDITDQ